MRFLIGAVLALASTIAFAGRGTDELLADLNGAVRQLTLTDEQHLLWNQLIVETTKHPDTVKGTNFAFKQIISEVLDDESLSFSDSQSRILDHFYGKFDAAVKSHYVFFMAWANFDASLTLEQRKLFRDKLRPRITYVFREMSRKNLKNIKIEKLDSDYYIGKLNYTPEQLSIISQLYTRQQDQIDALFKFNDYTNQQIEIVFADSTVPFSVVPELIQENFNQLRKLMVDLGNYYVDVQSTLNADQNTYLTGLYRTKLRLLKFMIKS